MSNGTSSVIRGKITQKQAARIEWLGQMNDRRKLAVESLDVEEMLRLASEYSQRGMVRTANGLYLQVREWSQNSTVASRR